MFAIVLFLIAACVCYYYTCVVRARFAQDVPCAQPCYPLIGNGLSFLEKSPVKLFQNVVRPFNQFDRWFKVWLGPQLMLCTSHPVLAESVLSHPKCLDKPFFYSFVQLEQGILTRKCVLASRRSALEEEFYAANDSPAMLDRLLSVNEDGPLSDTEIVQNIYSIVGAGNDTTAHSLGHTCLFLAMHPAVQGNLYQELRDVFYSTDEPTTEEKLKQLSYMECVIKESLRLAPPGATVAREAQEDLTVEGQLVPRGTTVVVSLFALHRRKDFWGAD
uniref:Uncharacterized protein n=1 Tax=Anopheles quadriannulatus TaxID=34691 RepID=A0A182XUM7_ANOQN